jgi:hypothetical protein
MHVLIGPGGCTQGIHSTVNSRRARECGICHWGIGHAGARRRRLNHGEREAPVWRMKLASTQGNASSRQSGDSAHGRAKAYAKTKSGTTQWLLVWSQNTVRPRSNLEDGRAKRHDGRAWLARRAKIGLQCRAVRVGAPVACRAGRIRSSCQLESPRNSRAFYIGAARSPTGSARAGEIACLSAGSSPMSPPRANAA